MTKSLATRRILIVGGAGYIGSVLSAHLLDAGFGVRSFDCLMYDHGTTVLPLVVHPGYEFVLGDLTDRDAFRAALDGITDVVLLAGLVGDPITKIFPDAAQSINDDGHGLMFEEINGRGLDRVIFVSTCSNYGLIEDGDLAAETHELNPLSLYAESKVRFESTLLGARKDTDFLPTVLRFATAFGLSSRMRFDLTVSEFTRALFLDRELLVYDAHTWRPYCHVRDFADVIQRVLEAPADDVAFDVFNAGGDANNFTKQMIVDAILAEIPKGRVRYQENSADPRNYRVDFSKIHDRLGFEPRYTVSDGIRELIAAHKNNLFTDAERQRNFYGNYELLAPGYMVS